jgi:filamentous hemagglutinin family protein
MKRNIGSCVFVFVVLFVSAPSIVQAQIIPAQNDTLTQVRIAPVNPQQIEIVGGVQSGQNLFHSFQQFGVGLGQTANFQSNPTIQNILGRVVGGEASMIHGRLQVTGGTSNLFLINPAGVLFGPNASLNLPASLTVTTANGIGIGNAWFNAVGFNDYSRLLGMPNQFAFTTAQPGAIANSAALDLGAGKSLTLLGGMVVNTGTIKTDGGQVTLMAVPGEALVRMSQPGQVLGLGLPLAIKGEINPAIAMPLFLPQLLTGGGVSHASGVTVKDGVITLTGSGVQIPNQAGVTVVSNGVDVSGPIGGQVDLLGTTVGVVDSKINASGVNGGGQVRIGGDYQGSGETPRSMRTVVNAGSRIQADAIASGNGGQVIIWSDGSTSYGGDITAQGGLVAGNGGLVEVSGKEQLGFQGRVNVGATQGQMGTVLLDPTNIYIQSGTSSPIAAETALTTTGQILAGDFPGEDLFISKTALENLTGNITLAATRDISVSDDLTLKPGGNAAQTLRLNAGRDFRALGTIRTQGRSIDITAPESFRFSSLSGGLFTSGGNITLNGNPEGNVTLNAGAGQIQVNGAIDADKLNLLGAGIRVGAVKAFNDVAFTGATTLTGGTISSFNGAITFNSPITLTGDTKVSNTKPITLNQSVNGNHKLTVSTTVLQLNAPIGNTTPLSAFEGLSTSGNISLGNNISTNGGDITLSSESQNSIVLTRDVTLSTGMAGGNIKLSGPVNSDLTPRNLTLIGGSGNISISGALPTNPLNQLMASGNDVVFEGEIKTSSDLTVNANNNIVLDSSKINAAGNIRLIANNKISAKDRTYAPLGIKAGGSLRLQGDQSVIIQATNNPLSEVYSGGDLALVSNGLMTTNARFLSGGRFSTLNLGGGSGVVRSDVNTVISAAGDVNFGVYEGLALKVESKGSISGGNITITGANATLRGSDPDLMQLTQGPAVVLRAGVPTLLNTPVSEAGTRDGFVLSANPTTPATISVGNIRTGLGGAVVLSAPGDVKAGAIRTRGDSIDPSVKPEPLIIPGSVELISQNGNIEVQTINTSGPDGGNVTIDARGTFRAVGTFLSPDFVDMNTNANAIAGRQALGASLLTSIYTTGVGAGGGKVNIRQSGTSFTVGPRFETDAAGAVVYRQFSRVGEEVVLGERVFPVRAANGKILFGQFVKADGTTLERFNVIAVSNPVVADNLDGSFTAGAITSNQENVGLVVSVRDRLFSTDLGTGGRVNVTFGPPIDRSGNGGGQGGNGGGQGSNGGGNGSNGGGNSGDGGGNGGGQSGNGGGQGEGNPNVDLSRQRTQTRKDCLPLGKGVPSAVKVKKAGSGDACKPMIEEAVLKILEP